MLLESSVIIHRSPEVVSAYLADPSKVSEWDRGVSRTEFDTQTRPGVGFEFDTLAHSRGKDERGEWGRMSYRIKEIDPVRGCTVELTSSAGNARYFRSAEWRFRVEAVKEGSQVFCVADFAVRRRYLLLAPIFYFMKNAIRKDLEGLKCKVESEPGENPS
ncbi:MAG TPA: SRPBCC family protein [Terracidiphilus sp.]|nr:SRPBCC family protein [Terracidiphilus sp.]